MARNEIQFQKGVSLIRFNSLYGTETQCYERLFNLRWGNGFICPSCGGKEYCKLKRHSLYQCNTCHQQTSLTAGTILDNTKLPLTKWFLAIFLLTQVKNGISALELSRLIEVSYNTAWRMKHKLMQAMKESDDKRQLDYIVQLDDAYWGGKTKG
ncbi:IS1595 family transposase, partial [Vibrio sp. 10N.222.55.C6]